MTKIKLLMNYDVIGMLRLLIDFFFTRILFPKARLIRRPFYIRGKDHIEWSSGLTGGVGLRIDCFSFGKKPVLTIGRDVQINDYVHIACVDNIYIGNNVLIASKVFITDHNHGCLSGDPEIQIPPKDRKITSNPVCIEDNVWLGENVVVLPGITIGQSSIIGASSVVTKSIPSYSIAVGNPAKVIKRYCDKRNKWVSLV